MYLIVEFDNNEVAIVPNNWLVGTGETCTMWPPYKNPGRLNSSVAKKEPPSECWTKEPITRVLYRSENFEKVRLKLKQAEIDSDLQTEEDAPIEKRKRRTPARLSDSETSEDEGPPVSKKKPTSAVKSNTVTVQSTSSPQRINTFQTPPPPPKINMPSRNQMESLSNDSPSAVQTPTSSLGQATVTQIFTLLEKLNNEQRDMKRLLHILVARRPAEEEPVSQLPEGISFPITTVEEMEAVDEHLNDAEKMTLVVRYLAKIGGSSLKETVSCFFRETVSNDVAIKYNLEGKKRKLPFRSLRMMTVLHKCLQRNPGSKGATKKDAELEVRKWLAGARDRDGGRKKRAAKIVSENDRQNESDDRQNESD